MLYYNVLFQKNPISPLGNVICSCSLSLFKVKILSQHVIHKSRIIATIIWNFLRISTSKNWFCWDSNVNFMVEVFMKKDKRCILAPESKYKPGVLNGYTKASWALAGGPSIWHMRTRVATYVVDHKSLLTKWRYI